MSEVGARSVQTPRLLQGIALVNSVNNCVGYFVVNLTWNKVIQKEGISTEKMPLLP